MPQPSGEEPAEYRRATEDCRRQAGVPGQPGLRAVGVGPAVEDAVRAEVVAVDPINRLE
jgi:hypothetical protein